MNFLKTFFLFLGLMNSNNPTSLISHEKEIDQIVNQSLKEFQVPGAALAVVIRDKIILCRGYGLRDLENNLPVTENTLFPIASNTKAFTSFLISQLVEEGKLAWDDPVIKYIPEFRLYNEELSTQATLRDLIAHRTGIPRHDVLWYLIRDLSEEDLLLALPHFPPISKLRETFVYNNFMYVVAGIVIYRVTNKTWEEELSSRILKPLGMDHSGSSNKLQNLSDVAQPYAKIGGKIQKFPFLFPCSTLAASAMHSSASDMAKWVQIQLFDKAQPDFIREETLAEMHTIHMPFAAQSPLGLIHMPHSPLEPSGYGLGWEIDAYRGHKQVHHGGVLEGFFSEVSFLPNEKIGIVILTNSSTDGRYAISCIKNKIYDYLLGIQEMDWIQKVREDHLKATPTPLLSLQKYEGNYTHPAYGTMQIFLEYDSLIATLGRMRVSLTHKSEGVFEANYPALLIYGINPLVEFSFFSDSLGEVDQVQVPFEHFRSAPPVTFKK